MKFGPFELDGAAERLTRNGQLIHLPPQAMKLLTYFVEHSGRLVTREELSEFLWDGRAAEYEAGINFCVRQIRQALGDDAGNPIFLETVPRRGYRFVHPVDKPVSRFRISHGIVGVGLLLVAVVGVRGLWPTGVPSLVVVPTRSSERDTDYIAEQFTEALVESLGARNDIRFASSEHSGDAVIAVESAVADSGGSITVRIAIVSEPDTVWAARMRGTRAELGALETDLIVETNRVLSGIVSGVRGPHGETEVVRTAGAGEGVND